MTVKDDYGKIEGLYGSIRDLDTLVQTTSADNYFVFEEYAKRDSEKFNLSYGVRSNLHYYEMIPKIGMLDEQKLKTYTISSLKIKFGHNRSYQSIKLSYFKIDLIDYEMNVCMQKIFMPEPYVTSKWLLIIAVFAGVSFCGLCFLKMFALNGNLSKAKKDEF